MAEAAIERWVREAARIARLPPAGDLAGDVMAPRSRLTAEQRRLVLEALRSREAMAEAEESS